MNVPNKSISTGTGTQLCPPTKMATKGSKMAKREKGGEKEIIIYFN